MSARRFPLPGLLRGLVLAVAAIQVCWSLTVASGVLSAALGALAGALAAERAARTRLRSPSALAIALVCLAAGAFAARWLVTWTPIAELLGPVVTVWLSEGLLWLLLVTPTVFALRLLASRRPAFAVLEVIAVAGAFAGALAAHRDGMVNRPLEIGDWAWSRGIDPVVVLLVLGGVGTLLLAGLLIAENRGRRLPLHFSVLLVVALVLTLLIRLGGLPKPNPGNLGLTGDPTEAKPDQGEEDDARGGGQGQDRKQMDDLEFKDEYQRSGHQAPVAVVLLHDDYSPPSGVYYFRQGAFSQFNGRRLVQATRDDVDRDLLKRFPTKLYQVPDAPPVSAQRAALRTSIGLLIDHIRPFALDSPAALRPTKNPSPMRFQRTFDVLSNVQTMPYDEMIGHRPGSASWSEAQWQHYTEAPSDPRYRELADRLVETLKPEYRHDPLAEALAIKTYLDDNGIYSLKSHHADNDDPTASFLFGDLTGYCVHFAHAAAYLLRTRGVPTRVATGYALAESRRAEGSTLMIRGNDAHAWPEIYLENVGWVVVDLAPHQTLDQPTEPPDQALQRMLGQMMREQMDEEIFADQLRQGLPWALFGRLLLGLLLALVAAAYLVKGYRAFAPSFAGAPELHRVGYRATLDRLAEIGLRRRFGESRERFAERIAEAMPSFPRLTDEHLARALGSRRPADAGDFRAWAAGVAREIRRHVPAWRRLLGRLNPFTWILVR